MDDPIEFKGGPHAVLLFHGLSSTPLELKIIGRGLARAGYTVSIPTIPGFTWQKGSQTRPDWRSWADSAVDLFDALQARHESVSVGGLCIGAVLALHVAARRAGRPTSVLALSTTLHYDGWSLPWYRGLLALAGWLPFADRYTLREGWPWGVKDPRMRQWIEQQMKSEGGSDAGAAELTAPNILNAKRLIRRTREMLPQITSPTLLVHALEDEVASPRSAEEVMRRIGAAKSRLVMLRDSYHMVSLDREKERVIEEMSSFLSVLAPVRPVQNARPTLIPISKPRTAQGN